MEPEDILYWNSIGDIACVRHAPGRGDKRWRQEGWKLMRPRIRESWKLLTGTAPICGVCDAEDERERLSRRRRERNE